MTQSLGHLAATVSLDINPFKAANGVLKAQIKLLIKHSHSYFRKGG